MWFIIGILIGIAGTYYYLRDRLQETEGSDYALQQKLLNAEAELRTLKSRLADCEKQEEELKATKAELKSVTKQLGAAKKESETPRGKQAVAEPKAEAKPEKAAAEPPESRAASVQPDNLRKLEGIGPKVAQVLNGAGILTFDQLAQTEVSRLGTILEEAGSAFKGMNPENWPDQASLAAKGDWDALKELQDKLKAGRQS